MNKRKSKITEGQIIGLFKQVEAGMVAEEICRKGGHSDATLYTWRSMMAALHVMAMWPGNHCMRMGTVAAAAAQCGLVRCCARRSAGIQ